jgi:hypothetical protein
MKSGRGGVHVISLSPNFEKCVKGVHLGVGETEQDG